MNEIINKIGKRMAIKATAVNHTIRSGMLEAAYNNDLARIPSFNEFSGMTQILDALEVAYSVDYSKRTRCIKSINILGNRFAVGN